MNPTQLPRLLWIVLICALTVLVYVIRLNGATDLESYGQPASIGHLLDLMTQGQLFVQRDLGGALMAAPPLHTWLVAPFAAVLGFNRLALTLPSFFSVLVLGVLIFETGRRRFGELAGGLAALALLLSPTLAKHVALAGADPLLALLVTAAALAAAALQDDGNGRRSRLVFWLMAALAVLTAGLPGLVLAVAGLFSRLWRANRNPPSAAARRAHLAGFALFVALVLAWLIPAGLDHGSAVAGSMLVPETAGWQPGAVAKFVVSLLVRYLPFSLFLFTALWQIVRRPAADAGERRFERFLASWLIVGLLAAALSGTAGVDLLLALWPAGALLAGREMRRLADRMGRTRFYGVAVVIGCVLIGATYKAVSSTDTANFSATALGRELRLAGDAQLAASALKAGGIDAGKLVHFGTPKTLQLYLGTFRPVVDRAQLEEMLADATAPVDLATGNAGVEELGLLQRYPATQSVFRWPEDPSLPAVVQVHRVAR